MTLKDLKNKILKHDIDDDLIIFETNNTFLAKHYIEAIVNIKYTDYRIVDDLVDTSSNYLDDSNILKIYYVDELKSLNTNSNLNNYIIVTKKNSTTLNAIKLPDDINMNHILDYIHVQCPGLSDNEVYSIYQSNKGDLYAIYNEISKLNIFDSNLQSDIYNSMSHDDLLNIDFFSVIQAIAKKDLPKISNLLRINRVIDTFGFLNQLCNEYHKIIDVLLDPNPYNKKLSNKQVWVINNIYKDIYTESQLISIYDFLTSLDSKIKLGELNIPNIVDYIIVEILAICSSVQ